MKGALVAILTLVAVSCPALCPADTVIVDYYGIIRNINNHNM